MLKKILPLVAFLVVGVLVFTPFFRFGASAAELGNTYLFLQRMQVETQTEMILLVTPSVDMDDSEEDRSLRIYFPAGEETDWCQANDAALTVSGVATSTVIDTGAWTIDGALPGGASLVAKCFQGAEGQSDYIEVTGIDDLTAASSYGLKINSSANFQTGTNVGDNLISVQLSEGDYVESISFSINLVTGDRVVVDADVSEAHTITCTIGTGTVNMGTLYKGGAYTTSSHNIATTSTTGFYWAVYGTGNGSTAGLYKSEETTDLLSAAGNGDVVNLLTGFGFGLGLSSASGTIPANYDYTNLGVFGALGSGFGNAKLMLSSTSATSGTLNSTVILGARAGVGSEEGAYQETLTYICGAYVAPEGL
jgi:hypothetical protein